MGKVFIALVGVAVGFGLTTGYAEWKNWRKRQRIHRAIFAELKSNLYFLPQKADVVKQLLSSLEQGKFLSGEGVRFAVQIYQNHYPKISDSATAKERNSLHVIYERFTLIDGTMASVGETLLKHSESKYAADVVGIQQCKLRDILFLIQSTERILRAHLAGKPEDVLHLESDFDQVKGSEFTPV
jgi:hypothetical protein